MDDRNISFKDFCKLSEIERAKRYKDLTDEDKFRARMSMVSGSKTVIPCNICKHRIHGKPACAAFPNGINQSHLKALIKDQEISCGKGYRFKPR